MLRCFACESATVETEDNITIVKEQSWRDNNGVVRRKIIGSVKWKIELCGSCLSKMAKEASMQSNKFMIVFSTVTGVVPYLFFSLLEFMVSSFFGAYSAVLNAGKSLSLLAMVIMWIVALIFIIKFINIYLQSPVSSITLSPELRKAAVCQSARNILDNLQRQKNDYNGKYHLPSGNISIDAIDVKYEVDEKCLQLLHAGKLK